MRFKPSCVIVCNTVAERQRNSANPLLFRPKSTIKLLANYFLDKFFFYDFE